MGFGIPTRTFQRLCLALLSVSSFGLSSTLACDNFGLKNVNDDEGDWIFSNFFGDCLLCFRGVGHNSPYPKLVLPCSDRLLQERKVQISYQFRRFGMHNPAQEDSVALSIERQEGTTCYDDYSSATNITRMAHPFITQGQQSNMGSEKTLMETLVPTISHRLKIQTSMDNDPPRFIVCLTNVTYMGVTEQTSLTSIRSSSNGNQNTVLVSVTEQTGTTSSRSSSNGNQKTAFDQEQSNFPFWVIFVIIAVLIISICAVAGICILRRKHHDHQPVNNVNTGKVNGTTNGIKDNMENDKDVIPNPTYGQEPVNEKEDEYHSYTEIDVKVPGNTEMIYNSAYESPPASSGMVYNSAYESEETNNDMIYNSAYGSSPSN